MFADCAQDGCGNAAFSMVPGQSVGTPQMSVIDPRTMEVTHLHEGMMPEGNYDELVAVAMHNKALWGD